MDKLYLTISLTITNYKFIRLPKPKDLISKACANLVYFLWHKTGLLISENNNDDTIKHFKYKENLI